MVNDCDYLIIPKESNRKVCSSCGVELPELHIYTQIATIYRCVSCDHDEMLSVVLGLGVPMCNECDEETFDTLETSKSKMKRLGIVLAIACMVLFILVRSIDLSYVWFLPAVVLAVICCLSENILAKINNEKMSDKGFNQVLPVLDGLKHRKWHQTPTGVKQKSEYNAMQLREDIHSICSKGNYRILKVSTGEIADYGNIEAINRIYQESLYTISK